MKGNLCSPLSCNQKLLLRATQPLVDAHVFQWPFTQHKAIMLDQLQRQMLAGLVVFTPVLARVLRTPPGGQPCCYIVPVAAWSVAPALGKASVGMARTSATAEEWFLLVGTVAADSAVGGAAATPLAIRASVHAVPTWMDCDQVDREPCNSNAFQGLILTSLLSLSLVLGGPPFND